ncbi:MAG: methyltransferase domain-containing protein [Bacteroidetes bacterium]|nr:methyltransferase domain-containing protein [Bacteroidota bacterium]
MDDRKRWSLEQCFGSDYEFNKLFPVSLQSLAARHWTPLHVTRQAVEFLYSGSACRILDIGSGIGKFCLAGAAYAPKAHFFGVEQRQELVGYAKTARNMLGLTNVSFIEANFTKIDFRHYDHFYFFNAFHENIDDSDRIDDRISYSYSLYDFYVRQLHGNFRIMPSGTKIVTYHTLWNEVPKEYRLMHTSENGTLNFWVKR